MKKLKKLALKKEVITNLNENEMNQVKGGGVTTIILICYPPFTEGAHWTCLPCLTTPTPTPTPSTRLDGDCFTMHPCDTHYNCA